MSPQRTTDRRTAFRRLSYGFSVRCNDDQIARYVWRILGRFADGATPPEAPTYEVLDLGSSDDRSRYGLLVQGEWLYGSETPASVLETFFSRINLDTMEASRQLVIVHAGTVTTPAGVGLLLPAPSGSGKSTLVAGLVRAGFGYLSDEAAVLDPLSGTLHPYPVHLSLKAASRERFPEAAPDRADLGYIGSTWFVDPDALRVGSVGASCEVGFVIPHRFQPGARTTIEPLTPAAACVELVQNLMLARRDTERSLEPLARICRASQSHRLTHGDLDAAVAAVVELTAG